MSSMLYLIFGLIETLVGLRFLFRLLGASPANALVSWVYGWSAPLVAPFGGIFGSPQVPTPGTAVSGVFEWAALIAFIVYGIIGSLLAGMLVRRHHDVRL